MVVYTDLGEENNTIYRTAAFLNRVMRKGHFTTNFLKWQYLDNPYGKAIAYCAFEDDIIIGHYAAQPIMSKINGELTKGLFILNAAVDPSHQGKGILRNIANLVHDKAEEAGYKFMIGVGNKNSTPIYTKSFGFTLLGPLDVKIGTGIPRIELKREYCYERVWDNVSLDWRLNNPSAKYKIHRSEDFVVYHRNYPLLNTIMGTFETHFNLGHEKNKTISGIIFHIGKDPSIDWSENRSYISYPEFAKPSPLNLIFKEIKKLSMSVSFDNMLFRCLDFDAF